MTPNCKAMCIRKLQICKTKNRLDFRISGLGDMVGGYANTGPYNSQSSGSRYPEPYNVTHQEADTLSRIRVTHQEAGILISLISTIVNH
uniref:Uncharacterized protein n=1 Tax=Pinctada fucata TaxID=50426 RepID=A0A194AL53_PINFU